MKIYITIPNIKRLHWFRDPANYFIVREYDCYCAQSLLLSETSLIQRNELALCSFFEVTSQLSTRIHQMKYYFLGWYADQKTALNCMVIPYLEFLLDIDSLDFEPAYTNCHAKELRRRFLICAVTGNPKLEITNLEEPAPWPIP